jgi:hypothetical protein
VRLPERAPLLLSVATPLQISPRSRTSGESFRWSALLGSARVESESATRSKMASNTEPLQVMLPNAALPETKPALTRKPSLCMKPAQVQPAASPPAAATSAPLTLTSKEWVIPPRPKPGRKPATDTPPTKRKAQNRAAQRAFRERRAARVGELEEQLKQIEDENEQEQDHLKATVDKLEKEVEKYRSELAQWVERCQQLEKELSAFRDTTISNSKPTSLPDAPDASANDSSLGCGNCTLETRCQCIDDAFAAMGGDTSSTPNAHHHHHHNLHEKRPHSPLRQSSSEKRVKVEVQESLEIDFTTAFAAKPAVSNSVDNRSPTSTVADPCGFCSDGTPCICAEVAAEQERQQLPAQDTTNMVNLHTRSTAPRQLDQFTPPPSEGDVSIPPPNANGGLLSSSSGCGPSGPGTCAQCRADPNSTLFCKSLAASRARATGVSSTDTGCCGGKTPGGSCCQSITDAVPLPGRVGVAQRNTRSRTTLNLLPPDMPKLSSGLILSCADAYTTLSRHPAYERAAGDIGQWLPKLHACEPSASGVEGRPALEIDAANVMAVLRDFDRRFGKS